MFVHFGSYLTYLDIKRHSCWYWIIWCMIWRFLWQPLNDLTLTRLWSSSRNGRYFESWELYFHIAGLLLNLYVPMGVSHLLIKLFFLWYQSTCEYELLHVSSMCKLLPLPMAYFQISLSFFLVILSVVYRA